MVWTLQLKDVDWLVILKNKDQLLLSARDTGEDT
jgi:hypothetical protein